MTPDEHAEWAEGYLQQADAAHRGYRPNMLTPEDGAIVLAEMTAFATLAQAHATLALRQPTVEQRYGAPGTRQGSGPSAALPDGVGPRHVPTNEELDYDGGRYGDGDGPDAGVHRR